MSDRVYCPCNSCTKPFKRGTCDDCKPFAKYNKYLGTIEEAKQKKHMLYLIKSM